MTVSPKTDSGLKMRPALQVMRLERMGCFHQSRLSFMRVLLRRLKAENWKFDRPRFDIDENGVGVATYRAIGPEHTYTLIAFSHDLPDEKRSDRVIADAWDATFTLMDGEPDDQDMDRLAANVPLQEAGRISEREMVLSRANKSVRMFDYVVDCLSHGKQPDIGELEAIGYLMRTTAVYGSGKFGAADRHDWADRPEFAGSFQPELLSVWLIRTFSIDLVEHLASARSPQKTAVRLDSGLKRRIGVGNSTGLGMAPFLMNHPSLIHAWVNARETALARVCNIEKASKNEIAQFGDLVRRSQVNAAQWHTDHPHQAEKTKGLRADLRKLEAYIQSGGLQCDYPWENLLAWVEANLGLEGQEQTVSLMLEPYGSLVDDLADTMSADESGLYRINGRMSVGELMELIEESYSWALDTDFALPTSDARVWYVSEEKLEPRLGERHEESLDSYEQPLSPGRDISRLYSDLMQMGREEIVGAFLMAHPEHRHSVRRVQHLASNPYGEIRDNTIASDMLPIDLLRCKLSFFGATKFDPRSDRWVRITMYQGAPFPDELAALDPDELAYPPVSFS